VPAEHFTVIEWTTADTGRPTLVTVQDLHSGDAFTAAILDPSELREPHALLAVSVAAELLAYGPFDGTQAAANAAPILALTLAEIRATRPVPLHRPEQPSLPDSTWCDLPSELTDLRPAPHDARHAVALALVDRDAGRLAAVGPFTSHAHAARWRPATAPALAENGSSSRCGRPRSKSPPYRLPARTPATEAAVTGRTSCGQ